MSELPKGWDYCHLGDLLSHIQAGKSVKCDERQPEGQEPGLVKISAVTWGTFDETESKTLFTDERLDQRNKIRPGDLLISRANTLELVGAPVIVGSITKNLYLSDKVLRLELDEGLRPWVLTCLKSASGRHQIEEMATGNQLSMRNISQDALRSIEIPLPPLREQARIASALDGLLAQVDTLKARLDALPPMIKRFRQAVLNAATTGQLTSNFRTENLGNNDGGGGTDTVRSIQKAKLSWAGSHREHNESKRVAKRAENWTTNGSSSAAFPVNWTLEKLEDVVLMVVDCHNKTAPYVEHGIPLVRTSNIRNGSIVWTGMKYVNEATYKFWSKRCPPKSGDLIFTREAPMGEVALIPSGETFCLGQRTMLIRPVEEGVSGRFLHYSIMSPGFQTRLEKSAVGGGVQHLRVGDVSELEVVIPPKAEQTEIVRRIDQFFAYANQLDVHLADARQRVDALTQSILAKAFRGELVPQDPNDEPASVLLERIAAQRAADPKPKRGRKTAAH